MSCVKLPTGSSALFAIRFCSMTFSGSLNKQSCITGITVDLLRTHPILWRGQELWTEKVAKMPPQTTSHMLHSQADFFLDAFLCRLQSRRRVRSGNLCTWFYRILQNFTGSLPVPCHKLWPAEEYHTAPLGQLHQVQMLWILRQILQTCCRTWCIDTYRLASCSRTTIKHSTSQHGTGAWKRC